MASNSQLHGVLSRNPKGKAYGGEDVPAPFVYQITKDKITIGRVKCDITIVSTYMSRLHAEIKLDKNKWTITDLSVNGTLLNGQLIGKGEVKELKSNDTIGFGGNSELDISYVLKLYLKKETKEPTTSKRLTNDTKSNVIVIDDSENENEGPSDRKRRREISPDNQTLLEKYKELEEKNRRLEFELAKTNEESGKKFEIQQKEMSLKEQEYELKLKMNAVNEKQDNERIEALKAELKSAKAEKAELENGLQKMENGKTKEIALELERAGLEWNLGEKSRICHKLESQLKEAQDKLEALKQTAVSATQSSPHTSKISSTVENELQCSICSELFIKATTLSCSHSFCDYCINEWKKTKKECPMCRKAITSAVPSIALDNFISQFIATLVPLQQEKRKEVVEERKAIAAASVPKATKKTTAVNNNGPQRGTRQRTVNRATITNTGNNFQVVTQVNVQSRSNTGPSVTVNTAINESVVIGDSDSDISDGDSSSDDTSSNDDSFISYDEENESDGSPESPGPYYGGYGNCFRCGRRGHWANACPY